MAMEPSVSGRPICRKVRGLACLSVLGLAAGTAHAEANANAPLDRPYTLRNPEPFLLERENHRQIDGEGPRSHIYPRPCRSPLDSSSVCRDPGGWVHRDSSRSGEIALSPRVGYEYRYDRENVHSFGLGGVAIGRSGPLSFGMDARMFTELHEDARHASYDREPVERQDQDVSGSIAYTSYSRFRSDLSCDWSWGRLTVARDVAHWGPGLFGNLVFNQESVPFNHLSFTAHLGPFTVHSLYGQLALDTNWEFDTTADFRSVYAHRYEWRATRNLVLGISEQLILHKREAPFAFIPLVPLYVSKAGEKERLNNGNIAADFSYRFSGLGAVYSEFLIDDIQAPTALFNEQWGNKWAWLAGCHLIRTLARGQAGLVAEYTRVEPWVYTHYLPRTAQAAHFDRPLGNQLGPNSQAVILKAYLRGWGSWYVSVRTDLSWKGADAGSSLLDTWNGEEKKWFLASDPGPEFAVSPYLAYLGWGWVTLTGQARLGSDPAALVSLDFRH